MGKKIRRSRPAKRVPRSVFEQLRTAIALMLQQINILTSVMEDIGAYVTDNSSSEDSSESSDASEASGRQISPCQYPQTAGPSTVPGPSMNQGPLPDDDAFDDFPLSPWVLDAVGGIMSSSGLSQTNGFSYCKDLSDDRENRGGRSRTPPHPRRCRSSCSLDTPHHGARVRKSSATVTRVLPSTNNEDCGVHAGLPKPRIAKDKPTAKGADWSSGNSDCSSPDSLGCVPLDPTKAWRYWRQELQSQDIFGPTPDVVPTDPSPSLVQSVPHTLDKNDSELHLKKGGGDVSSKSDQAANNKKTSPKSNKTGEPDAKAGENLKENTVAVLTISSSEEDDFVAIPRKRKASAFGCGAKQGKRRPLPADVTGEKPGPSRSVGRPIQSRAPTNEGGNTRTRPTAAVLERTAELHSRKERLQRELESLSKQIEKEQQDLDGEGISLVSNESAFEGSANRLQFRPKKHYETSESFFEKNRSKIREAIDRVRRGIGDSAVKLSFTAKFKSEDDSNKKFVGHLWSTRLNLDREADTDAALDSLFESIYHAQENYVSEKSNMGFDGAESLDVYVDEIEPPRVKLGGALPPGNPPLPRYLLSKKGRFILNPPNRLNMCFFYAMLACRYSLKARELTVSKCERVNVKFLPDGTPNTKYLCFDGVTYPFDLKFISKFENKNNVPVWILTFDRLEKSFRTIHVPTVKVTDDSYFEICTLLYYRHDQNSSVGHFYSIKDPGALLFGTDGRKRHVPCFYCLRKLSPTYGIQEHLKNCTKFGFQQVKMPSEKEKFVSFKNYGRRIVQAYVSYMTFETVRSPVTENFGPSVENIKKHEVCAVAWLTVDRSSQIVHHSYYSGEDVFLSLWKEMIPYSEQLIEKLRTTNYPIGYSKQKLDFWIKESICFCCEKKILDGEKRHHHHDHFVRPDGVLDNDFSVDPSQQQTGNFVGICHDGCNLNLKQKLTHFIFSQGFSKFHSVYIIRSAIAYNSQRDTKSHSPELHIFITPKSGVTEFTAVRIKWAYEVPDGTNAKGEPRTKKHWYCVSFHDSSSFLSEGCIDDTVKNLPDSEFVPLFNFCEKLYGTRSLGDELKLRRIFPSGYITSFSVLQESFLPPHADFQTDGDSVPSDEVKRAKELFHKLKCRNIGSYLEVCSLFDVVKLACAFESLRRRFMRSFQLEPVGYYSLSAYGYDLMLFLMPRNQRHFELLCDPDIDEMFRKSAIGGVCHLSKRLSFANSPEFPETYNPELPTKHLLSLDMNSMYPYALTFPLPTSSFEFLPLFRVEEFKVSDYNPDSGVGFLLEVDLELPTEFHDYVCDYPFPAERMTVNYSDLGDFNRNLVDSGIPWMQSEKVVLNLKPKHNFVVHIRALKTYIEHGCVVTKIHRIVRFKEVAFAQPFMERMKKERQGATSEDAKQMWKRVMNSVYGRLLGNPRKRENVFVVTDRKSFIEHSNSPNFQTSIILAENVAIVKKRFSSVKMLAPFAPGSACLNFSKAIMLDFHMKVMKKKFPHCQLLCSNTDNGIWEVGPNSFIQTLENDQEFRAMIDTSNLTMHPHLQNPSLASEFGLFKSETGSKSISGFVGLKSNVYALKFGSGQDEEEKKRASGTGTKISNKFLTFDKYLRILTDCSILRTRNISIINRGMYHYTVEKNSISLGPIHDKIVVLGPEGIFGLPHGHYKVCDCEKCVHYKTTKLPGITFAQEAGELDSEDEDILSLLENLREQSDVHMN